MTSNLIILPGSDEAEKSTGIRTNYFGRTLALNTQNIKKFQTLGFYLGPNRPFAPVPENADMVSIMTAVLRHDLIDVTDGQKGLGVDGTTVSAVQTTEDPNKRSVFIGYRKPEMGSVSVGTRQLFVAIPESEEQEREFLLQLETRGLIEGEYRQFSSPDVSVSGIQVSEIDPRPPIASRGTSGWSHILKGLRLLLSDLAFWRRRQR